MTDDELIDQKDAWLLAGAISERARIVGIIKMYSNMYPKKLSYEKIEELLKEIESKK